MMRTVTSAWTILVAALISTSATATSPQVRWFVSGSRPNGEGAPDRPAEVSFLATNPVSDGFIDCCSILRINGTGALVSQPVNQSAVSAVHASGRTALAVIDGLNDACASFPRPCAIWENREQLSSDLAAYAVENGLDGFSLDWEFGGSFNWGKFDLTWKFIADQLRSHNITVDVCINSVVESKSWAKGSDPSANPYFRDYSWADRVTDMGTYALCVDNNCTDEQRAYNLTQNLEVYKPKSTDTSGWAGGLQGRSVNLVTLGNYRTDQLSPGLWLSNDCAPTGVEGQTSTKGWTAASLRAFLADAHGQGIRSVDIWCGLMPDALPDLPCPTCPWVYTELARWKALGS